MGAPGDDEARLRRAQAISLGLGAILLLMACCVAAIPGGEDHLGRLFKPLFWGLAVSGVILVSARTLGHALELLGEMIHWLEQRSSRESSTTAAAVMLVVILMAMGACCAKWVGAAAY
jgi:hypothetical protein